MKKLAVIVAVVSMFALAGFAYGEMGGHGMGPEMMSSCGCGMGMGMGMGDRMMGGEHPMMKHLRGLNLDEQQKALIGEIKSKTMKEMIRRTADMHIVQIELKDLMSQEPVDMKAVEAKLRQLEMMKTEMHLSHIRAMEDIKTKLTPEQRKKFKEMSEAGPMMEGRGKMHDRECSKTRE
jgi:Spy/CpxP family protein refolding chaperone